MRSNNSNSEGQSIKGLKAVRFISCILAALVILFTGITSAYAASANDGFDPNADNTVYAIAVQADGKILIGGKFRNIGTTARNRIARLNADGTLDTTFDPNANNVISSIVVRADGKILVAGGFTQIGTTTRNYIALLNPDGTVDPAFDPNAGDWVNCMAVQANGKILVGGDFTTIGGQTAYKLSRLNTDGSLDTTFTPNASGNIISMAVQADGKILVAGGITNLGRMARLNADGTTDTTFNPNPDTTPISIAVQADGKILLGGNFTTIGTTTRKCIARLNRDGTLDTTFTASADNAVYYIEVQADGKILIGGAFTSITTKTAATRNRIARLNADGSLDTAFNPNANSTVNSIAVEANGNILIGGGFTTIGGTTRNYIARLNADGSSDTIFNLGANGNVNSIAVQADGKILVGGNFTTIGTTTRNYIARLNADGSLDTTFNPNADSYVYAIAVQADGKILLGGAFTTISGTARNRIARLNTNGTLDVSFTPSANNSVNSIAVEANGNILIGGAFTSITTKTAATRNRIARLYASGLLDTSFDPNASGTVNSIAVQADGKILVGGSFTTIVATARNSIARLNNSGTLDTAFDPNSGDSVNSIAVQADDKILIGGLFTTIGGTTRNRIARLNANGSVDTTFDPNAGSTVFSIAVQADGKILVGGAFTKIGTTTRNYIARLNSDGTLDAAFDPSADNTVYSMAVQADGKILVGGGFTTIGGTTRNRIARLSADYAALQNLSVSADGTTVTWTRGQSSPEVHAVTFERSSDMTNWTDLGTVARITGGWQLTGLTTLPSGVNDYIRARGKAYGGYYNDSNSIMESIRQYYNKAYTLTYYGNTNTGGTAPVDSSSPYAPGKTVTVSGAGTLVKTGYTLAGWNTAADGSGTAYAVAATFTISADTTLYAQWTVATFTVTPSAGTGGSISPNTAQTVNYNNAASFTITPDTGYKIATPVGGTCGGALSGNIYTTSAITANCTVSAAFIKTYTVTPSAGLNGSISPSGLQTITSGSTTTFTVTPDTGYTASVGGTCGGALVGTTYTTSAITADCTVLASFTQNTHKVTTQATNGTITSENNPTVNYGSTTTVTGTANAGYYFVSVSGCGLGLVAGNSTARFSTLLGVTGTTGTTPVQTTTFSYTTAPITGDCTVTATFALKTYTVTPSAGTGGTISPATNQTVDHGSTKQFAVTPSAGYTASVGGTCGGTLSGNTYTTNAITANCTVAATFIATYTVTPSAGANGSISPTAVQTINSGSTTIFTVTPDAGYAATVGGTCGGTLSGNTYTTNAITANCTVAATFALKTYTVTPSVGAGGSMSPNTAQTVNHGSAISFTITPNAGYKITTPVSGTCGGTLSDNIYTTKAITGNCTVNVTFAASSYTITPSAGSNGSISPNTGQTVSYNSTKNFTVTPAAGYIATVGGTCEGTLSGNTYTTKAITADCTVAATFASSAYTVTTTATNGIITSPKNPTANYGLTTTVTGSASTGYYFTGVSGCGGTAQTNATQTTTTFSYTTGAITANCTTAATFALKTYTVTPSAGANGSIFAATPQTINHGSTPAFTVTPNTGYAATVGGSCGGSLSGNTYTTRAITSDCTVVASFSPAVVSTLAVVTNGGAAIMGQDNTPVIVDAGVTVVNSAGNITGGKVSITSGFVSGSDTLACTGNGTISCSYNSTTGILTFTGTDTPANWQAIFRTVTIATTSSSTTARNVAFTIGSAIPYTGTGHFYEYISAAGSWTTAKAAAEAKTLFGLQGYLATITSQGENDFIRQKLGADAWIGASDEYTQINAATGTTTYASQSSALGRFYWVSGPEKGINFSNSLNNPIPVTGEYMNWNTGEPNNNAGEYYTEFYAATGGWGDRVDSTSLGYVVEYGGLPGDPSVTLTASKVVNSTPSVTATQSNGAGVIYAPNAVTANCTVTANFAISAYTVTPSAGTGGSLSPSGAQTVNYGSAISFNVTTNTGYTIASVTGCGGTLSGSIYTTGAITANCTVAATFIRTYTVTPSAGAGGAISPGAQTVNSGSTISFNVMPHAGHSIASVGGSCGGTLVGTTFTTNAITADCTVAATFAMNTYTVTPGAGTGGSISPNTAQTVNFGSALSFTINPNVGYKIVTPVGGTCGGTLAGNIYTTNAVAADCTVNVTFAIDTHKVTSSAGSGGSISPNTVLTVNYGSVVNFTVTPNAGYTASVSGTCGGTLSGNTYTTNAITADCTVAAAFTLNTYTVTPGAGTGGSISPNSPTKVNYGNTAAFTLTPEGGYNISSVTGCGGSLAGDVYTTGVITADCAVNAVFVKKTFTVTPSAGTNGSINPAVPVTVTYNATTSLTVTPDTGYNIVSVKGCGGTLSGSTYTTGPITGDCSVVANFNINSYSISGTVLGSGGGMSCSPDTVNYGGSFVCTMTPDTGYHLDTLIDNEAIVTASVSGNKYTSNSVKANHDVKAVFAINTYLATPSAGENGSLSPSTSQIVDYGATATFTLKPKEGYHITSASGCGGTLAGSTYTTGPITANCNVSATFAINVYTVTSSSGANGTVTANAVEGLAQSSNGVTTSPVSHGNTMSLTITHDAGYHIDTVTGSCGGKLTGDTYLINPVSADCTVIANFAVNRYTVTTTTGEHGIIHPGINSELDYNNTAVFTVTADTGYNINSVTGCGGSLSGNTYTTGLVTGDCTISATFQVNYYNIAGSVFTSTGGNVNCASPVAYLSQAACAITAPDGYSLSALKDNGADVLNSVSGGVYTINNIAADHNVIASFVINTYTVTSTAGSGGSISPSGAQTVNYGNAVTFLVAPAAGYSIASVSDTCGSNGATNGTRTGGVYATGAITANCAVTATFTLNHYTLTITDNANVTTSQTVNANSSQTLTITPLTGYHVAEIFGCGNSWVAPVPYTTGAISFTTGTITSDCTVTAFYEVNPYTVITAVGAGGSLSPEASQTVSYGTVLDFTITPNSGYSLLTISGCSGTRAGNTYTTGTITANCTVTATFIAIYIVTPSAGTGGTISPGEQTVNTGLTTTFSVTPNTGYTASVGGTCGGTLSGGTYTTNAITSNCTVAATFTLNTYTVTPGAGAGAGGSISPNTAQTVAYGNSISFTITPNTGYEIVAPVGGTCGGALSGNIYTTNAVAANCTVNVTFATATHTVTSSAGTGGSISPNSVQTVNYGSTVSFTITPSTGYKIVTPVGGSCGGTLSDNTYTTNAITADCTVAAAFALNTYAVTPGAGTGGSLSPNSLTIVTYGNTATFTLSPDTGYSISSATGCGGTLTGNVYTTGAITADCAVSATFVIKTFTVTPSAGANGSLSPSTSQTVNYNATTSFTVTPDTGYNIVSVKGCGGTLSGSTYTTGPITGDCSVVAGFNANSYSVSGLVSGSGGVISCSPDMVNYGGSSVCAITPDTGYHLDTLTDNNAIVTALVSGNKYTVSAVKANHEVKAVFAINTYLVTPSAGENGSISPNTSQTVNYGAKATFTLKPKEGYHIASVTGCGGALSGSTYTTGAVTANCNVSATFAVNVYTVTSMAEAHGTVTPNVVEGQGQAQSSQGLADPSVQAGYSNNLTTQSTQTVSYGNTLSFTITPDTGYHIDTVTGSCGGRLVGHTYLINPVSSDCTVIAQFAINQYTVTATPGAHGTITPGVNGAVDYNNTAAFTITADTGYSINSVAGCGGALSGNTYTTGPVTGDCTISATFQLNYYNIVGSVSTSTGGNVKCASPVAYMGQAACVITAPEGYSLSALTDNGANVLNSVTGGIYTINNIAADHNIAASFVINTYILVVTPGAGTGGSIAPNTPQTINYGDAAAFLLTSDAGYSIASVSDTCGSNGASNGTRTGKVYATGAITANCSVTATFELNQYTLTLSDNANVTTSQTANADNTQTLTITPEAGYHVAAISGCGNSWTAPVPYTAGAISFTTGIIMSDCTVSVFYEINSYSVTASAGANGSISPEVSQTVSHGTALQFTVTSGVGYTASVGGTCGGTLSGHTYTTNAVTSDCSVAVSFSSTGPFLFNPTVNYGVGASPEATVTGDFNGDGIPDLAVVNSGSGTVSILLGNGDGTFQPAVSYAVGTNPSGISIGDFNGDGKLDLAVTNGGSNDVSILLGNGDGTFQTAVSYAVGTNPSGVSIGDFNGDGIPDLAVVNSGSGTVSILLGNGDGTFQTAVSYAVGTNPSGISIGDFNGDGKLDLAVTNGGSNDVSTLLGNGDGTFQTAVNYAVSTNPSGVSVGDFNGDGIPDLAVVNSGSGTVSILLGNGDGTFQPAVNYAVGTNPSGISIGDFNGDGKPDLVVTNQDSGTVSILLGNGDGTFGTAINYIVAGGPSSVTVGDFNGDGRPDIVVTNFNGNNVSILVNVVPYIVTPSAAAGGTISPSTSRAIAPGLRTAFTVTPNSGYRIASVTGCGGTLSGHTYTTGAITANCTVTATFRVDTSNTLATYTVTPSAGPNGTISPSTAQSVTYGATTTFTVMPDTGYTISAVGGTCGGTLVGTTYTTNAITANCTVTATFTASTPIFCSYTITSVSSSFDASGGKGTVTVTGSSTGCLRVATNNAIWLATSNAAWITINSGSIGDTSSTVDFTVDRNAGAARTGTLTIAGQTFTVTQSGLQYTLLTLTKSGTGSGRGLINNSSSELLCGLDCQVAVLQYEAGTAINLSATPETGTTFNGWSGGGCAGTGICTVTLNEDISVNAVFSSATAPQTDSSTTTIGTSGNGSSINVPVIKYTDSTGLTTYYSTTFVYVPTSDSKMWVQLTNGNVVTDIAPYTGTLMSELFYSGSDLMLHLNNVTINEFYLWVDLKYMPTNDGNIWFVVTGYGLNTQDACTYGISPEKQSLDSTGGIGSVNITASSDTCFWTASSNDAWLTITSGSSGSGNGTFGFTAEANTGAARTGTLTIAGRTFTVTQSGMQYSLTITKSGTGAGKGLIHNSGSELLCGADCEFAVLQYEAGSTITLFATPEVGMAFKGWTGGGCSGAGLCTVTLNEDTSINAVFSSGTAPVTDSSTATIGTSGTDIYINVPVIKYTDSTGSTTYYSTTFVYVPTSDNKIWFKLAGINAVTDITSYTGTHMSELYYTGSDLMLHLYNITMNNAYLWADLKYMPTNDSQYWFVVTGAGGN